MKTVLLSGGVGFIACNTFGLPLVISNCSNNYGSFQFPEKLIPLFIHNVKNKKPLSVYGKGENIRDWFWIVDHACAMDVIFHKGKIGETYKIGGFNEWTNIDHCTYYGNGTSVACFEKNAGDAGGNATVTNSILSNTYDATYSSDEFSTLKISNSASDNEYLPSGKNNLFVNPQFKNPNLFDFNLVASSACFSAGTTGNMGASQSETPNVNQLFISAIAYKSDLISDINEFVELSNSGNTEIDISGFEFTKGIVFQFPEASKIKGGEKIYVAYDSGSDYWQRRGQVVFRWESGRLADEGETIQLETEEGIIVDNVQYKSSVPWPEIANGQGILLKSENLDNHFGENWKTAELNILVNAKDIISAESGISLYPNPTTGVVNISALVGNEMVVNVFNMSGVHVKSKVLNTNLSQIDLGNLEQGVYVIHCGSYSQRVVLMK